MNGSVLKDYLCVQKGNCVSGMVGSKFYRGMEGVN